VALVQSHEQRGIMRRLQATMAVVEGYSEHVMDAVGAEALPGYEHMREAMDRRRQSRSAPHRILERLLGLDLKMRQYVIGKKFCDAVVESHGIEVLNRVWQAPELLPSLGELDRPADWVARVEKEPAAA
jgi:putative hydrolase